MSNNNFYNNVQGSTAANIYQSLGSVNPTNITANAATTVYSSSSCSNSTSISIYGSGGQAIQVGNNTHEMIEVGTRRNISVNLISQQHYAACWGDLSTISFEFPTDKIKLYYYDRIDKVEKQYSPGSSIPKWRLSTQNYGTVSISVSIEAMLPSNTWDDISIVAKGVPNTRSSISASSSSSDSSSNNHTHPECVSSPPFNLTAYSIEIKVREKPWGGTWIDPEDSGTRPVNNKNRKWYHLWTVNENAIRAEVFPDVLSKIVINTTFGNLSVGDFISPNTPPGSASPAWKRITAPVNFYSPVHATIHFAPGASSSSSSAAVTTSSLTGIQQPVDVVVNNIQSVEWVTTGAATHQLILPTHTADLGILESHGNGYRIFPDALIANPHLPYNKVHAKVTLAIVVPQAMKAKIHLKHFDPDNPLPGDQSDIANNSQLPDDNYGDFVNWNNSLVFDSSVPRRHTSHDQNTARVQYCYGAIYPAHAGDNYILAVHPNMEGLNSYQFHLDGKTLERPNNGVWVPLDSGLRSSTMTVWRKLRVECDVMKYYPGPNNTGTIVTPPNPIDFLNGFVIRELALACVLPVPFVPNNNQPPIGNNPITPAQLQTISGGVGTNSGRDISGNSHYFWTVRIVMASKNGVNLGEFHPGTNTVILYYEKIKEYYEQVGYIGGGINDMIRFILLHEVGHVLLSGSNHDHVDGGVMAAAVSKHEHFAAEHLHEIQKNSRANN